MLARTRPHAHAPLPSAPRSQPLVESEESIYRLDKDDTASVVSSVVPNDSGAAPAAASAGVGNLLILDCRTFEAYTKCHVYGAVHYDVAMLSRATNNFPREVYYFRGPIECDKMVVLYDEDGKTGAALGNKFVEMGIENTYVLHGGFLGACAACPAALTGAPPEAEELAEMMARAGLKRSKGTRGLGSAAGGSVARCSTAGSTCTQNTKLSVASSSFAGRSHWK